MENKVAIEAQVDAAFLLAVRSIQEALAKGCQVDLTGPVFPLNTNLGESNLLGANLTEANLWGADLRAW